MAQVTADRKEKTALDKILERLDGIEAQVSKIKTIEERLEKVENARPFQPQLILRPNKEDQPTIPNLYSEIFPRVTASSLFSVKDNEVDVKPLINQTLSETLSVFNNLTKTKNVKEITTEELSKTINKSRSSISGRLNILYKYGLVDKTSGKKMKYFLTEKGKKLIKND